MGALVWTYYSKTTDIDLQGNEGISTYSVNVELTLKGIEGRSFKRESFYEVTKEALMRHKLDDPKAFLESLADHGMYSFIDHILKTGKYEAGDREIEVPKQIKEEIEDRFGPFKPFE